MKRMLAFLLIITLSSAFFTGCGTDADQVETHEKVKIVTTIFPQYDFTRQIAGDNVEITMLLSPGAESHTYEPSPKDIITIQECDLFIYGGGESDSWMDTVLESVDTDKMKIISLMDCVDVVEEVLVEGMEEEEEEPVAAEEVEYDEHVWTSIENAILITEAITTALCEIDEINTETYKTNSEAYINQLQELDASFKEAVLSAKRTIFVFGDRFPFRYFADEYGLEYYAAFPGCAAETEASASTVAFLIDKVKEEKIPVVFSLELSKGLIADTICESTGAKKLLFHSCHNVTVEEFEAGATYLELMTQNLANLKEALN